MDRDIPILGFARSLQTLAREAEVPADVIRAPGFEPVLNSGLVRGAPWYVVRIVDQVNVCYVHSCFDAAAVLLRRLFETLLIEMFESKSAAGEIKDQHGRFFGFSDLIDLTLKSGHWNLSREAQTQLPKLRDLGNRSAHNRRYIARRKDIEPHIDRFRLLLEELVHTANLISA